MKRGCFPVLLSALVLGGLFIAKNNTTDVATTVDKTVATVQQAKATAEKVSEVVTPQPETVNATLDAASQALTKASEMADKAKEAKEKTTNTINSIKNLFGDKPSEEVLVDETSSLLDLATADRTQWGGYYQFGELDDLGRPTFAHARVADAQEPGTNGVKRDEKINTNPTAWKNYRVSVGSTKSYAYDRTHLVGWQFLGINDDIRNLTIGTPYLNRGVAQTGSDQTNPDGMLFYEQQLDSWLANHPHYSLDLKVIPIYQGTEMVPRQVLMRWVGVDNNGGLLQINIGGKSYPVGDGFYEVVLDNTSPVYTIDYQTTQIIQ